MLLPCIGSVGSNGSCLLVFFPPQHLWDLGRQPLQDWWWLQSPPTCITLHPPIHSPSEPKVQTLHACFPFHGGLLASDLSSTNNFCMTLDPHLPSSGPQVFHLPLNEGHSGSLCPFSFELYQQTTALSNPLLLFGGRAFLSSYCVTCAPT